jgi:hypothetical protein
LIIQYTLYARGPSNDVFGIDKMGFVDLVKGDFAKMEDDVSRRWMR